MRAAAFPGEDPEQLKTPDEAAQKMLELCLPTFAGSGQLYSFPAGKFLEFHRPS
jgi:hypothetical protein